MSAPTSSPDANTVAALKETARRLAYDRYISALLAPTDAQLDLITLAAFTGEVGRISLTVTEAPLAEIRFQWWRDALNTLQEGGRTGSPVADALGDMIKRHNLPPVLFEAIIEGRSRELYADGVTNEAMFTSYLEETEGAAFRLAAVILGADATPEIDTLATHAAISYGCVQTAMNLPHHVVRGQSPLPVAFYGPDGDPRTLASDEAQKAIATARGALCTQASEHLNSFQNASLSMPRSIFAAFLPMSLVRHYTKHVKSQAAGARQDPVEVLEVSRAARIGWTYMRRKY